MAGQSPERAAIGAIQRTIPDSRYRLAVGAAGTTLNLGAVTATEGPDTSTAKSLAGKWIYLHAVGGDITIMRTAAPGAAGAGFVIASGEIEEFYVDAGGSLVLGARAGSSINLDVLYDTEL